MIIETEVEIQAAHRLSYYGGACFRLHGHAWLVKIHVEKEQLDDNGMLVDFKQIKEFVNIYDHRTILFIHDPLNKLIASKFPTAWVEWTNFNPTCENFAKYLARAIRDFSEAESVTVKVYETKRSFAQYTSEGVDSYVQS